MKWKSWLWTLGMKPRLREYGTQRVQFQLERDGTIEFDKWLHPKDYFRPFDQAQLDALRNILPAGDTAIDIGAHSGDFAIQIGLAAGPRGIVFAWEPNPYVFPVLLKNANLNHGKINIVPVQAAATRTPGEVEFSYSDPGFCNGGQLAGISRWRHGHAFRVKVPGLRVNDWLVQNYPERIARLSLVKIDTEGADLEVLQSMDAVIRMQMPHLHFEVYRHRTRQERSELFQFVQSLGYAIYKTDDQSPWTPKLTIDDSDASRWEHFDVIAIPRSTRRRVRAA